MAKKPRIHKTRVLGINVLAGGKASPRAHLIYEVMWDDGTFSTMIGNNVQTVTGSEHLNGSKKQIKESLKNLRVDLFEVMHAIATLIAPVEKACLDLDNQTVFVGENRIHE